jgi:hypothetical protein
MDTDDHCSSNENVYKLRSFDSFERHDIKKSFGNL